MTKNQTQTFGQVLDKLEHNVKKAREHYDCRNLDQIDAILDDLVETYAQHNAFHSALLGSLRNMAVRHIATHLNRLQDKYAFQDAYRITYDLNKMGTP